MSAFVRFVLSTSLPELAPAYGAATAGGARLGAELRTKGPCKVQDQQSWTWGALQCFITGRVRWLDIFELSLHAPEIVGEAGGGNDERL